MNQRNTVVDAGQRDMAKEEEEEKKESAEGEAAAKPKSKKKLIIIIAVVVLLVAIGVPLALLGGKKEAPAGGAEGAEEASHEEEKHYATFDMDTIIVNLSENASFLKVTLIVEYDPEILAKYSGGEEEGGGHAYGGAGAGDGGKKGGMPGALGNREPMIKDSIIRVLSSKRPEEVLTAEGKERLKEELIEAINETSGLEEGPVVNIYFKDFIVQ